MLADVLAAVDANATSAVHVKVDCDCLAALVFHMHSIVDTTDIVNPVDIVYTGNMQTVTPRTGPILNFVVDSQLIQRLDDFRYKYRFPTRAAAVKWLLDEALTQDLHPVSDPKP